MWIGLLWYLNFVQIPSMPKISDDQKPAITKVIAPAVLFWFRWAAFGNNYYWFNCCLFKWIFTSINDTWDWKWWW